jgi:hypothetical protein
MGGDSASRQRVAFSVVEALPTIHGLSIIATDDLRITDVVRVADDFGALPMLCALPMILRITDVVRVADDFAR